jgi:hypothetical protein
MRSEQVSKCHQCGNQLGKGTTGKGRCRACYEGRSFFGLKTSRYERDSWREWVKTTPYTECGLTEIADDADVATAAIGWIVRELKNLTADGYIDSMPTELIVAIDLARDYALSAQQKETGQM